MLLFASSGFSFGAMLYHRMKQSSLPQRIPCGCTLWNKWNKAKRRQSSKTMAHALPYSLRMMIKHWENWQPFYLRGCALLYMTVSCAVCISLAWWEWQLLCEGALLSVFEKMNVIKLDGCNPVSTRELKKD